MVHKINLYVFGRKLYNFCRKLYLFSIQMVDFLSEFELFSDIDWV